MALDSTTIIMHYRGVSGGPSLVLSLSVGADMQNPRSQRGPICSTCGVNGGPSLANYQKPMLSYFSPHERRLICLQKTLFELERLLQCCDNICTILAQHRSRSLFSMILMGPLKSMCPAVIVPTPSRRPCARLPNILLYLPARICFANKIKLISV